MNKKKFLISLGVICIIAFLIRIQVAHELACVDSSVANPTDVTDMYTYKELSDKILEGKFNQPFYYQPFYYAVFLPVIKFCFGPSIWPVIIFQCLLSALTVWFSALSAAMIRSAKAGILTAVMLAFSTILILYTPYCLIATLQAFWVSLILFLCIRFISKYRFSTGKEFRICCVDTALIGFVAGTAILTRGNIWFFVPGIISMFFLTQKKHRNNYKRLLLAIIFLVFILLPQIPFAWKNTKINKQLTGPSTAAGSVLALGNTPEAPPGGRDPGTGPGAMEYPDTCESWGKQADEISVFSQILRWFAREPLAFIEFQCRKMLLFWDYREIPNNIAIESQGLKSNILTLIGFIPVRSLNTPQGVYKFIAYDFVPMSFIILGLGLAGSISVFIRIFSNGIKGVIGKLERKLPEYLLLYFILAYWLATAAFYILARFRVPVIPLLAVAAALFICRAYNCLFRKRRKKIVLQTIVVFLCSIYTVLLGFSVYRYVFEPEIISVVRPDGVQSKLHDNTLLIKDNGPQSFGSWGIISLKDGQILEKSFSLPKLDLKKYSVKLKIDLYWKIPGTAVLKINGKMFTVKERSPGFKPHEFILNDISDGKVVIIPERLDCSLFSFIDRQRDYGRTEINNEDPGGELVCALYIKENDKR